MPETPPARDDADSATLTGEVLPAADGQVPDVTRDRDGGEQSLHAPGPRAEAVLAAARAYAARAAAPATLRAYRADWAHYAAWCAVTRLVPVPAQPATVGQDTRVLPVRGRSDGARGIASRH